MSASQAARPLYLQGAGAPFFAFLHKAADPPAQRAALLCPPFGWDDVLSYRIRREWAEHLVREGYTTLRIDFPGSGDSAGFPTDPGRLGAWTQAVDAAARWLRRVEGARQVVAIGIGLGGLVACAAALEGAQIEELVLWAVPARGRTLLRELRTFSAMEVANMLEAGETPPESEPAEDGAVVTNGYLLSAETVRELERLDLAEVEPASRATRRALLLARDQMKLDKALPIALERAGAAVTVADGPGYGAMIPTDASPARPPSEVFELVSSWLREEKPRSHAAIAASERRSAADAGASSEPIDHDEIVLRHSGEALRERPIYFDGPGGRLFGVITEPLGACADVTVLLLNAGPQRRTGPNRMWVEAARRWAANGVPSLRIDAAAIGDFDGHGAVIERIADYYKPLYVEQTSAALEMLAERGLPPRFVVVGMCAGGYCSAQVALADERVAAAVMLNPRTLIFDDWEWRNTLRHMHNLRERILLPSTWRKVLTGEIALAMHLRAGRALIARPASMSMLARERIAARRRQNGAAGGRNSREPIEDLFDGLRDRGQRVVLMFTGQEPLNRELSRKGVFDQLERWPNLELALLGSSADTHALTPLWLQRDVHALLDRVLQHELTHLVEA